MEPLEISTFNKSHQDPFKIMVFLIRQLRRAIFILFGDYLSPNWKFNIVVLHLSFMLALTVFCYIGQAYKARDNLKDFLFVVCLATFDGLAIERLIEFYLKHDLFCSIIEKMKVFVEKWEQREEGHDILLWYFNLLKRVNIIVTNGMLTSGSIIMFTPIVVYLIFGRKVLLVQCFIPLVDHTTHPGFELHIWMHGTCVVLCLSAASIVIFNVTLILGIVCAAVDILKVRLSQLINILEMENHKETNVIKVLNEIIQEHKKILEIVDQFEMFVSSQQFTDHLLLGVQICLSLYICSTQFFLLGYLMIIVCIIMVLTANLLGSIVDMKLESLCNGVYDVAWYLMKPKTRKQFLFFLINTQKTQRITIGGHVLLSLESFYIYIKAIYSYLMFLKQSA